MTTIGRIQGASGCGLLLLALFVLLYGFAQPTRADQATAEVTTRNVFFAPLSSQNMLVKYAPRVVQSIRTQSRRGSADNHAPQRSMSEAIAIAKQKVPGEVVSARKQINKKGEGVYHIKILSNQGVVRRVRVQASR